MYATHNLTANVANLNIWTHYSSTNKNCTANGSSLKISHVSSSILHSLTSSFKLWKVYHVPFVKKNMLFASQFTKDNNVVFEFHPTFCRVKDRSFRNLLRKDHNKSGLYYLNDAHTTNKALYNQISERELHPTSSTNKFLLLFGMSASVI